MSQAELQIVINAAGKVQIEVKGVQGPGCTELTRQLEAALGDVEKRDYKAEYYVSQTGSSDIQHQQY